MGPQVLPRRPPFPPLQNGVRTCLLPRAVVRIHKAILSSGPKPTLRRCSRCVFIKHGARDEPETLWVLDRHWFSYSSLCSRKRDYHFPTSQLRTLRHRGVKEIACITQLRGGKAGGRSRMETHECNPSVLSTACHTVRIRCSMSGPVGKVPKATGKSGPICIWPVVFAESSLSHEVPCLEHRKLLSSTASKQLFKILSINPFLSLQKSVV